MLSVTLHILHQDFYILYDSWELIQLVDDHLLLFPAESLLLIGNLLHNAITTFWNIPFIDLFSDKIDSVGFCSRTCNLVFYFLQGWPCSFYNHLIWFSSFFKSIPFLVRLIEHCFSYFKSNFFTLILFIILLFFPKFMYVLFYF